MVEILSSDDFKSWKVSGMKEQFFATLIPTPEQIMPIIQKMGDWEKLNGDKMQILTIGEFTFAHFISKRLKAESLHVYVSYGLHDTYIEI